MLTFQSPKIVEMWMEKYYNDSALTSESYTKRGKALSPCQGIFI